MLICLTQLLVYIFCLFVSQIFPESDHFFLSLCSDLPCALACHTVGAPLRNSPNAFPTEPKEGFEKCRLIRVTLVLKTTSGFWLLWGCAKSFSRSEGLHAQILAASQIPPSPSLCIKLQPRLPSFSSSHKWSTVFSLGLCTCWAASLQPLGLLSFQEIFFLIFQISATNVCPKRNLHYLLPIVLCLMQTAPNPSLS